MLTFARPVMETIGEKLVPLGAWPALLAVTAQAAVLQAFGVIGVPVSASQAVVGIGLVKGVAAVNAQQLLAVVAAWALTPAIAGLVGYALWLTVARVLPG